MNVNISPELEQLIISKVESGRYESPSDVLKTALLVLEERESIESYYAGSIGSMIDDALDSLDRGEGVDGEEFMAKMIEELDNATLAENADTNRTNRAA